jgi:hypothetical protein
VRECGSFLERPNAQCYCLHPTRNFSTRPLKKMKILP